MTGIYMMLENIVWYGRLIKWFWLSFWCNL